MLKHIPTKLLKVPKTIQRLKNSSFRMSKYEIKRENNGVVAARGATITKFPLFKARMRRIGPKLERIPAIVNMFKSFRSQALNMFLFFGSMNSEAMSQEVIVVIAAAMIGSVSEVTPAFLSAIEDPYETDAANG